MPRVLVADKISAEGIEILRRVADVDVKVDMSEQELLDCVADYDGIIVRSSTQVNTAVIAAAPNLKIVGRAGVGVDNIDVPAATERGIIVVNSPQGNTLAAAELTIAHLLALSRRIPEADASVKRGEWERSRFVGIEVYNKTLGILGLGKIGREVAIRAKSFGMRIIAQDPFLPVDTASSLGIRMVELDELLKESDYITLHIPRNKETVGMIGAAEIEKMKKDVRVINVARGGIIDEAALAAALESGKIAGAAVDVYSNEPFAKDNPLRTAPNTITTPHLGASTEEAQSKVAVDVAEQMVDYFNGIPPRAAVNMPAVSAEVLSRIAPFLTLAEHIGSLVAQIADGRIEKITVSVFGEIASEETGPVTRAVLSGMLSHMLTHRVNFVNALVVAESRGIRVSESKGTGMADFASLVAVEAVTDKEVRRVSGTVFDKLELRIIDIDDFRVGLKPEGTMLIAPHIDRPGRVGKVGTILGNNGINIGGMYVGREDAGSRAVMALVVDESVPAGVMREIEQVEGLESVRQVIF